MTEKVSDKSQQVSEVPKAQPAADPSPKRFQLRLRRSMESLTKISSVTASELNNKHVQLLWRLMQMKR